jgi:uncharacterized protein
MPNSYYVYVYIDPRNFEEFYYGKGKGNRKNAHLSDDSDSEKTKRIQSIHKEGLEPIIKVVAKNLTEAEAFLIEKTLIWKLGRNLTNISSGHFQDKFRPHNTLHLNLNGFDYANGIYYVNVGECERRSWEDCLKLGFLAAGGGAVWSDPLKTLNEGDLVMAYLKGKGYVGVGRVLEPAKPVLDFRLKGRPLTKEDLKNEGLFNDCTTENTEYLVKVDWIKAVTAKEAKWQSKAGLFATQQIRASLEKQVMTLDFIEKEFDLNLEELMNQNC